MEEMLMAQLNTRLLLRSDTTANWSREILVEGSTTDYQAIGAHAVLGQGELGIEFLTDGTSKIKIGDGVTIWKNLDYFGGEIPEVVDTNVFEVEPNEGETHEAAINRVVNNAVLAKGDIAYVKELIVDGQYSYTGYVYNGSAWAAMDGNYDASNVYFKDDMTFTTNIGTAVLENGKNSGTFSSKGKSLEQVLKSLLAVVKDPDIKLPTLSLSAGRTTDTGTLELGSKITAVTYNGTFMDGQYEFGWDDNGTPNTTLSDADKRAGYVYPKAGCSATYTVTCDKEAGVEKTSEDGTFTLTDSITIDSESAKVYATVNSTCEYTSASHTPVNNIGEVLDDQKIVGTSIEKSASLSLTGYREGYFSGNLTTAKNEFTSADIRGLTMSKAKFAAGVKTFTVNPGTATVVFAVPQNHKVTNVHNETVNANMNEAFKLSSPLVVNVEGANGYSAVAYNVYAYTPDLAYSSSATLKVTIA